MARAKTKKECLDELREALKHTNAKIDSYLIELNSHVKRFEIAKAGKAANSVMNYLGAKETLLQCIKRFE